MEQMLFRLDKISAHLGELIIAMNIIVCVRSGNHNC